MQGKYKVITLCGSTKFKEDFLRAEKELTLKGYIVLSVGSFSHADGEILSDETIDMLDDIHRHKIDMSDEIFVININGYIGESTNGEIEYAISKGKKVNYMYVSCECDCYYCGLNCLNKENPYCIKMDVLYSENKYPKCSYYKEWK